MEKEHWIVKNNTGGHLYLPKLGLSFKERNNEKEICFLTGKSVEELENNSEISSHIISGNLLTVSKQKRIQDNEDLIKEINELKDIIKNDKKEPETKAPEPAPVIEQNTTIQQLDVSSIIEAIKSEIKSNMGSMNYTENSKNVVSSTSDDEKAREDAIKQLLFKGKDTSTRNFDDLGSETQVENEGEGNEDLLGDLPDL